MNQNLQNSSDEIKRIKDAYEKRKVSTPPGRYSSHDKAHLFACSQRERTVLKNLEKENMLPLWGKKILEVGCGNGSIMEDFIRYNANPANLYGVELLRERVERVKQLDPDIKISCQSAEKIPYQDKMFDLVMQFTMFTSILDSNMKSQIAMEMIRVLKDDGIILWYDYFCSNPGNPDVKGIKRKEIKSLFPGCKYYFIRTTLAPPITRTVIKLSRAACYLLEMLPFLRTHYVAVIQKV